MLLKFNSYLGLLFFGRGYFARDFLFSLYWIRRAFVAKMLGPFSDGAWDLQLAAAVDSACRRGVLNVKASVGHGFLSLVAGVYGEYSAPFLKLIVAVIIRLYSLTVYEVDTDVSLFFQKCLSECLT